MSTPSRYYVVLSNHGGTLGAEGADDLEEAQRLAVKTAKDMFPGDTLKIEEE